MSKIKTIKDCLSKEEMFPLFDELHSNQCKYKPFGDTPYLWDMELR